MKMKLALIVTIFVLMSISASANVTPMVIYEYIKEHDNLGMICQNIELSTNTSAQDEVQTVLDRYKFTKDYTENEFDCSDMSQLVWLILTQYGYNATMMYGINEKTNMAHIWVRCVSTTGETLMIECINRPTIGTVVPKDKEKKYNSGLIINSSSELCKIWPDDGIVNDANIVQMKQELTVRVR